jgi:hypothetical protein
MHAGRLACLLACLAWPWAQSPHLPSLGLTCRHDPSYLRGGSPVRLVSRRQASRSDRLEMAAEFFFFFSWDSVTVVVVRMAGVVWRSKRSKLSSVTNKILKLNYHQTRPLRYGTTSNKKGFTVPYVQDLPILLASGVIYCSVDVC